MRFGIYPLTAYLLCKYKHYICKYLISNKEKHKQVAN